MNKLEQLLERFDSKWGKKFIGHAGQFVRLKQFLTNTITEVLKDVVPEKRNENRWGFTREELGHNKCRDKILAKINEWEK